MRILQINDYPPGDARAGGAEGQFALVGDLLRSGGHDVEAFTVGDLRDPKRTPRRYISNPIARRALQDQLEQFQPDVVHLHNFYHILSPGILHELRRYRGSQPDVKVVMTAHDAHLICPNPALSEWCGDRYEPVDPTSVPSRFWQTAWDGRGRGHTLLKQIQHVWHYRWRRAQRVIDTVLCPSQFLTRLMRDRGLPAVYLPNPTPEVGLAARPDTGDDDPARPLQLIFVGRIEPEKGLRSFLEELPVHWTGQMTVVGEGSQRRPCELLVRLRGFEDRVQFVGRQPQAEAWRMIAEADALVLPSRCYDNAPLTLIEALAQGTNIIVSNIGGMQEIVDAFGVGYTFDVDDGESIRAALAAVEQAHAAGTLNDFDVREQIEARSSSRYVERLLTIYGAPVPPEPSMAEIEVLHGRSATPVSTIER